MQFGLQDAELHTAWMLRRYLEQESITGFEVQLPSSKSISLADL
jgi:hypothetical protein